MSRVIVALLCATLVISGGLPLLPAGPAYADFEAPPRPDPPLPDPSPDPSPEPQKQEQPKAKKKFRISKETAIKIAACTIGKGILEVGKPLPLPKMSKRQKARFNAEVKFYGRAKLAWGLGCGLAPNAGAGVVIGAGAIALMDFHSRFISGERPIKRTSRQEAMMFCRDGSSPCPSLVGVDPDMYGPR